MTYSSALGKGSPALVLEKPERMGTHSTSTVGFNQWTIGIFGTSR